MPYEFNDMQRVAIANLQAAFPTIKDKRELVEGPIAEWAAGPLPPWTNLDRYKLTGVRLHQYYFF